MKTTFFYGVLFSFFALLSCNQTRQEKGTLSLLPDSIYLKRGDQLVAVTFDTLRNSLLAAIREQGFADAVKFCNERAYPLTASYATDGIILKRTSARYRNPANQPDSLEQTILEAFQTDGSHTKLIHTPGEVHYIKPIVTQAMCLNCHGSPNTDIKPETQAALQKTYPQDKATGYAESELRGIWHIIFPANPN